MALEERLTRLEVTVATGFLETGARIERLEGSFRGEIARLDLGLRDVESRLRVLIEAGRDEQRMMAEAFGSALERIEARLGQMHQEHVQAHGDHATVIKDHERRLTTLERRRRDSRSGK